MLTVDQIRLQHSHEGKLSQIFCPPTCTHTVTWFENCGTFRARSLHSRLSLTFQQVMFTFLSKHASSTHHSRWRLFLPSAFLCYYSCCTFSKMLHAVMLQELHVCYINFHKQFLHLHCLKDPYQLATILCMC